MMIRIVKITAIFLLTLLLGITAFAYWLVGTVSGGHFLVETALPYATPYFPANAQLKVTGIEIDTLADVHIEHLELSDSEGIWFHIKNLNLKWTPLDMLHKTFTAQEISAARIDFFRPPLQEEPKQTLSLHERITEWLNQAENLPKTFLHFSMPLIRIAKLDIPVVHVQSGIAELPTTFSLSGEMNTANNPVKGEIRLNSDKGRFVSASLSAEGSLEDMNIILQWREAEGGILAKTLQFEKHTFTHMTISASLKDESLALDMAIDAGEIPVMNAQIQNQDFSAEINSPFLLSALKGFTKPIFLKGTLANQNDALILSLSGQTESYVLEENIFKNPDIKLDIAITDELKPFTVNTVLHTDFVQKQQKPLPLTFTLSANGSQENWDIHNLEIQAVQSNLKTQGTVNLVEGSSALQGELFVQLPLEKDAEPVQNFKAHIDMQGRSLWQKPDVQSTIELYEMHAGLPDEIQKLLSLPITIGVKTDLPHIRFNLESKSLEGKGTYFSEAKTANETLVEAKIDLKPFQAAGLNFTEPIAMTGYYKVNSTGELTATHKNTRLFIHYALKEKDFFLDKLAFTAGDDIDLKGNLTIDQKNLLAEGSLSGFVRSLAPLTDIGLTFPDIAASKGQIAVVLKPKDRIQHAALTFDAGNFFLSETLDIAGLTVKADADLPKDKPVYLDASVKATGINAPLVLNNADIVAKGPFDALTIHAEANRIKDKLSAKIDAKLTLMENLFELDLTKLQSNWQDHSLSLKNPTKATFKNGDITIKESSLILDESAKVTLSADLNRQSVAGKLQIKKLPFSRLPIGSFTSMNGAIDASLTLSGKPENPVIAFNAASEGMQRKYPDGKDKHQTKPLIAAVKGTVREHQLRANLDIHDKNKESTLQGNLNMPFTLALVPSNYRIEPGNSVNASLKADLILAPFMPLALPDGVYGNGHLVADFTVNGAIMSPKIEGAIDVHSGYLEILSIGTVLKNMTVKAKASGSKITLTEATATDGQKGRLSLSGTMEATPKMPLDFKVNVNRMTCLRHPNANAILSGDLTLSGDYNASNFGGNLIIDRARLTIAGQEDKNKVIEIPVQNVASLNDPVTPNLKDKKTKTSAIKDDGFYDHMKLGLNIKATNQVFIEGFGLDSELKGQVAVSGAMTDPQVTGNMETLRGQWEFVGRKFTITRGQATLRKEAIASPLLDIEAQSETGGVTAIANIRGAATEPKITFTSIPSMPQDEILSRVMFGKNLTGISPFQAIELAQMLRNLGGNGGGISTFSKIKDTVGIDDLTIGGSGGAENMTVGVGKHVSDKVYVGVQGGAGEKSGKVSMEVDLTPHISVETEARQTAETAVRVNYKYDY